MVKEREVTVTPINKDVEGVQIVKNGNACYVNLPAPFMKRHGLKEGQMIDYTVKNVVLGLMSHNLFGQLTG